ncbi:MAG: alpha-amylase [Treponema sp.]|nr:alpha-amylase [Treponema sp.]
MKQLVIKLSRFEDLGTGPEPQAPQGPVAANRRTVMEFHVCRPVREEYGLDHALFSLRGNVILVNFRQVRDFTAKLNAKAPPGRFIRAGQLNAMGLIDEILHYMVALYRERVQPDVFETALLRLETRLGKDRIDALLTTFCTKFPPQQVYTRNMTVETYLKSSEAGESCRSLALEELMLLSLANLNPAFNPFLFLFDDKDLEEKTVYNDAIAELRNHFAALPSFGSEGMNLWDLLRSPALASPGSLSGQLEYMRKRWGLLLGKFVARLLISLDVIKEEEKPVFFGPGPTQVITYDGLDEYERFSPDQDWMSRTVLIAKSTLVWLYQLSQKYGRPIERLDQIPDTELDELAQRGFTGLWLIGLWERSTASKTIKQWTGNPEAAASAYSLHDYDIAGELGGWGSLANLRDRCFKRGIRLGSDMVPNHTGIDSRWVMEHPDRFLQLQWPPFPTYTFNSGDLSSREGITVQIEDHYYTRTDAAVVFKRIDHHTGDVRYIYHGNDGTSMPWNDTAQIDFLNPDAREAVIRTIVGVCKQFSIVRFDAAMTLAKRHIQRLWYPEPGHGGDIASRSEYAISADEFNRRIPNEFWREVVDRCAAEAPHTLLLAEAFWMMEGYFVRTLGMHRVYNSAFMNMLKNEENAKYRATIKNTLEFDPEVLKRFVNFMNNPDEETAVAQFGKGEKYFGICTLLVTMPGLPMFGHGQIEGFEEKYGMEYRRSYKDEQPDQYLVDRHEREIFPLMKRRQVFSGSADFCLYDLYSSGGSVNENVFAYSNRMGDDRALVFYNNAYPQASGWIHHGAVNIPQKDGGFRQDSLIQALSLHHDDHYYTLFREQRSQLWYLRPAKELADRGFFVLLNGYEAQVFLDIHDVEDTQGRWARLCAELNGKGVPDPAASLQDLLLKELYNPFMELFKPERMDKLYRIFAGEVKSTDIEVAERVTQLLGDPLQEPQFASALRESASAFIAIAQDYITGGQYDPFNTEGEHLRIKGEEVRHELKPFFNRLRILAELGATPPQKGDEPAIRFLRNLGKHLIAKPTIAAFALGYRVLALLRPIIGAGARGVDAKALVDHWHLDRKLREAYGALGIPGDEAYRITELMKAVLSRTSPADGAALYPESLILENYTAEDFRTILGVNIFEDITWFRKESFEEALFYVPLFLIMESDTAFAEATAPADPVAWLKQVGTIAAVAEQFGKAEALSGYRLDRLIEALAETGSPKVPKKGGQKGSTTKRKT